MSNHLALMRRWRNNGNSINCICSPLSAGTTRQGWWSGEVLWALGRPLPLIILEVLGIGVYWYFYKWIIYFTLGTPLIFNIINFVILPLLFCDFLLRR